MSSIRPAISVIIEGYNESLLLGSAGNSLAGLLRQDFPLDRVQVLLLGRRTECLKWRNTSAADQARFHSFCLIEEDEAHYYDLKNLGADAADADILVFLDSDTVPSAGWLSAIADGFKRGARVQAGVSMFIGEGGQSCDSLTLTAAASISWGFIVPLPGEPEARGFLSHNLAIDADLFRSIRYRSDLGRTCAGSFLSANLKKKSIPIRFESGQSVAHVFDLKWWLTRLHVRFGYEVFRLRRLEGGSRHTWVRRLRWLEPVLVGAWHVALDFPQWWRYGRARKLTVAAILTGLPVVFGLSLAARGAEVYGMYATLRDPDRMEAFALSN
ncbi:MAG: glycosyltransferase family A protein [Pirellulaceae bacterium]